jgi:hypothetical protein
MQLVTVFDLAAQFDHLGPATRTTPRDDPA